MATADDVEAPRAHALLSASGAYRWTVCTRAPRFEERFKETPSAYAAEGTAAHSLGEYCLSGSMATEDVSDFTIAGFWAEAYAAFDEVPELTDEIKRELRRHVQFYVDYVNALPGTKMVEQRVNFSHLVPEGFGTSDAIALDNVTVHIGDLKYGKGIKVFANGPQLKLYALGALHDYGFIFDGVEKVVLHIVQPRLDHVDQCEISVEELIEFGLWIKERAEIAYRGDGEFVAGDHCGFCKGKKVCKARAEFNLRIAQEEFGEPCPSGDQLTLEDIGRLLPLLDDIAKWCTDIQEHALSEALAGRIAPGHKVVEGRSTRKWTDELAVANAMRAEGLTNEQIYTMKLVGLTEAEKLLGKKSEVFNLATKFPGKPTLVPLSDKRQPLTRTSAVSDFAD